MSGATAPKLAGLASGAVNVVIGTHALLSRHVVFGKLGLLIIDEEHRFGVRHKEKLKQMREGVHVLTLTATPIPRTMQLALSPVRQLSLLMTPPPGRRPIATTIVTAGDPAIPAALLAEKERGGQSYYVCPRIADLEDAKTRLGSIGGLTVETIHGRMAARDVDRVMQRFSQAAFDILLCTTIVESGLDVPNANTLVIQDAHRLGLAQLYQIRGRIGRSDRSSIACLVVPADIETKRAARRRLDVLRNLDAVGAGFTLANEDMDIRGAGNLVRDEQTGHIKDIGFRSLSKAARSRHGGIARGAGRGLERHLGAGDHGRFGRHDASKLHTGRPGPDRSVLAPWSVRLGRWRGRAAGGNGGSLRDGTAADRATCGSCPASHHMQ